MKAFAKLLAGLSVITLLGGCAFDGCDRFVDLKGDRITQPVVQTVSVAHQTPTESAAAQH